MASTLYIVSDLHLGAGKDPETQRWSRFEDFFYDTELVSFIDHLCQLQRDESEPLRLILNGDCIDFLTVVDVPSSSEAASYELRPRRFSQKFGLPPTVRASLWKLDRILRGHPAVFDALARLLSCGGEIVILPGNHDPELFFTEIQERLSEFLLERASAQEPECVPQELKARLRFEPWFWYEPGRIFVEHGHQYDETNVVSHLLYPLTPDRGRDTDSEIDLPVGSFFVRFLHNGLKRQNPYMRNFVSLGHYLEFLSSQNILRSLLQSYRNGTFLLRALAETPLWTGERTQRLFRRHRELRDALASETGLGSALAELEALWPVQMARTKARLTRKLALPVLRQVGIALTAVVATIYLWSLLFNLILAVPWLAEGPFAKAGWLALFAVLTFVAVAATVRTLGRVLRTTTEASFSSLHQSAQRAADKVKTPNICMGHTHLADHRRFPSGAVYINTGTWTDMQGPWNQIRPRAMQFTFARLDDDGFRLLRWDHPGREAVPVDLFEPPRESLLQTLEQVADKLTAGPGLPGEK